MGVAAAVATDARRIWSGGSAGVAPSVDGVERSDARSVNENVGMLLSTATQGRAERLVVVIPEPLVPAEMRKD